MPVSEYYKGKGRKVMKSMKKHYGSEKGESVFYATANKRGMKGSGTFTTAERDRGYKVMATASELYKLCEDMADMRGTMSPDNRVHPQMRHEHSRMTHNSHKERY